jgi:branched-chain amino acid transport system substrate-binding protein
VALLVAMFVSLATLPALAQTTVKIAFVDPLSGGAASTGEAGLKTFQYLAAQLNAAGGPAGFKFEVTGYDNKVNPQESLVQIQKAIDAGARIIVQGNGSAVAAAIIDFINKYNERNPGKEIIFLNYAAIDPLLTNDKCSFWHFRWDASVDIKLEALTSFMMPQTAIKKVYLINQDYSFGRSVRDVARAMLAKKRPDIEIVGDELHPLQKVTDFAPYIAKIKASGADTVVTGNWAQDFALLLKAASDAGLQVGWYTFYSDSPGGPTAIRQANLPGRVFRVGESVFNLPHPPLQEFETAFRAKVGQANTYPRAVNLMRMLAAAIDKAKSADPKDIAKALEGMKFPVIAGGEGMMRADDHQFFQPMHIAVFGPDSVKPFAEEDTGWGWKPVATIPMADTMVPTTCKMQRPG